MNNGLELAQLVVSGYSEKALQLAQQMLDEHKKSVAERAEAQRLRDERDAKETEARQTRRQRIQELRNEFEKPIKRQLRTAAKHLNGNASRLALVAYKYSRGVSYVGCSFSNLIDTLFEQLIGIRKYSQYDSKVHAPDPKEVEMMLTLIRNTKNPQGRTGNE